MNHAEILALYDATMRADPPADAGISYHRTAGLVYASGAYECVLWSRLDDENVADAIAHVKRHVAATRKELEWKVYGHDRPLDLGSRLAQAGFVADESETLMAFDVAVGLRDTRAADGITIERVTSAAGLASFARVVDAGFANGSRTSVDRFGERLTDPTLVLLSASVGDKVVAGARLELPAGRPFAGLWGAVTDPEYRRRGIFTELVRARASIAQDAGYRYLNVDARETSRPVLTRLGFEPLTPVVGWILRPHE